MKSSFPDSIKTYSLGSRKTISQLIISAKNDQRSVASISSVLKNISSIGKYNGLDIQPYSLVSFELFLDFFRDMNLKTLQYYDAMNGISTLFNGYIEILNSELSKLDKNIKELETFTNNFSFISGEDDLYNGNFIESFVDDSNSYFSESFQNKQYDRNGLELDPQCFGIVDSVSGTLKSGTAFINNNYVPKLESYENNFSSYISSSSDITNLFSDSSNKSWNVTVKAPSVITSYNKDFNEINYNFSNIKGANASLTFVFENPQEMNVMRIAPNMGTNFQLIQVIIYSAINPTNSSPSNSSLNNSENKTFLLDSPLLIESIKDISFEKLLVKKIKLVINQPKYKRITNTSSASDNQSKTINAYIQMIRNARSKKHDKLQDVVYSYFTKRNEIFQLSSNVDYIPNYYSYRYPCENTEPLYGSLHEFLSSKKNFVELYNKDKMQNTNKLSHIVESVVAYVLGNKYRMSSNYYIASRPTQDSNNIGSVDFLGSIQINNLQSSHGVEWQNNDPYFAVSNEKTAQQFLSSLDVTNSYEYLFSIKNLKFGNISHSTTSNNSNSYNNSVSSKTVFISKPIDSSGHVNKVKIKSNYFLTKNTNNQSDLNTSATIEFSISSNVNAQKDIDWIPILPYDQDKVYGELLFPSSVNGFAELRFAAKSETIKLYKNGILLPDKSFEVSNSRSVNSINIINYRTHDKYVVEYIPLDIDSTKEIDFSSRFIQSYSTTTYISNGGLGEVVSSTGAENTVRLSYDPCVKYAKFANHTYSFSSGTIGIGGTETYSPLTVILEDGKPAVNLTNYLPNKYVKYRLPDNFINETYYIHSGNSITFSKRVSNARVIYDYIPGSLRYKIVIRNLSSLDNSSYVDNFIMKYQQSANDNLTNKLLKVT